MNAVRFIVFLAALILPALQAGEDSPAWKKPYRAPAAPAKADWPREKLVKFMRELADFVYDHHVVKDENRKTFGMVYEFHKDGKQRQEFGLDSMHDGAWFVSAMMAAQRADPEGRYLERAQKFQIPFYTNMLNNSERLFPQMQPTQEDKKPFDKPVKGWVPRGWDDGGGFTRNGKPIADGYFTSSNHLAQDLADMLLDVWMTTRDPAVAEAAMNLRNYKKAYFGSIPAVEFAAGVANAQPEHYRVGPASLPAAQALPFAPQLLGPYYTGLYEQKDAALPSYDDNLAWQYRQAAAQFLLGGEIPKSAALGCIARAYGHAAAMEIFHDDSGASVLARPAGTPALPGYAHGMYFFDIQRPPRFVAEKGRLDHYASTSPALFGGRGIQISAVAAALLPFLKANPELWESPYRERPVAPASVPVGLVRNVDDPPLTDGVKDESYAKSTALAAPGATVTLLADPRNLHVFVESSRPQVAVEIWPAGAVAGAKGTGKLVFSRNGEEAALKALNSQDVELLHTVAFKVAPASAPAAWTAEARIPFTAVPGQKHWINGVEHGQYKVMIDLESTHVAYFLSEPERVLKRCEDAALGTIATWHGVWKELGIIPSAYGGASRVPAWEISDAGNYAHLIKLIAYWILYKDGTSEWEIIKARHPETPLPAQPLTEAVLKAQGLQ